MKKLTRYATPREIFKARHEWATYLRLRRTPTKACIQCQQIYPNTEEYFAVGRHLTSTCIQCTKASYNPKPKPVQRMCPICGQNAILVKDGRVNHCLPMVGGQFSNPVEVFLCRRCLLASKFFIDNPEIGLQLAKYVIWRETINQEKVPNGLERNDFRPARRAETERGSRDAVGD